MRTRTAPVLGEDGLEVNSAVEAETAVGEDIDPVSLVIAGGIEHAYLLSQDQSPHPNTSAM